MLLRTSERVQTTEILCPDAEAWMIDAVHGACTRLTTSDSGEISHFSIAINRGKVTCAD
jgi:hypothetical protein